MEKDLCKFMDNVKILGKELVIYTDESKGVMFPLNTVHLLTRVDAMELSKQEYTIAKFEQKIEDLDYTIETIKRPVPKNEITGKEEDKYVIAEKDVAVRKIWNVSNQVGAFKSYTNKEDAMKKAKEINDLIMTYILK